MNPDPRRLGGVIHTYQKYDPLQFPSPTQPPPDLVSPAFEHLMMYGNMRRLTPEELARAIKLDPSQLAGLGPSLESLLAILRERKRKILTKYETNTVRKQVARVYEKAARQMQPPDKFRSRLKQAVEDEQIYDLERLWYAIGDDTSPLARQLVGVIEALGEKYQIDELVSKYEFKGHDPLSVPKALEVKEELEKIDKLIEQLEEAMKTAQIAIIDMDALAEFTEPGDLSKLEELQRTAENMLREMAEQQGLEQQANGQFQLTPHAYRIFQSRLLERIFSHLQESRTGRHQGPVVGEGAVETQRSKPYEFGDSLTHMDIPQTLINAMLRQGTERPLRLTTDDIVVQRTRNTPKCATVVIMDMSGSMRYEGQYMHVKRMALALDGLIRREYPGDALQFIEMYTFAKPCLPGQIVELMPKPVTIHDPWVRLKVDMSREDVSEYQIPPHFTNMQHALRLARQYLAAQDTLNRQIILISDGLPTAHFEDSTLFMLYPPEKRTEEATMREALSCHRDGITINMFLVPSWSQSEEDIRFAYRMAQSTRGRVFFTAGGDLDRYVVWDYLSRKREIIG